MERLNPTISQIAQEYVLVQAWKKVSTYIRYHNWFSDTIDIDATTADLPSFIAAISNSIQSGEWIADRLRLVSAPKSAKWKVDPRNGKWAPESQLTAKALRPLAHVSLRDQVVAAAIMLCLSERVETLQGDPRSNFKSAATRYRVISYGNRLYCDTDRSTGNLVHRWGSAKLYRAYFDDYRSFIARPEYVAEILHQEKCSVAIVQSDLKQFYDRVRPSTLSVKNSKAPARE